MNRTFRTLIEAAILAPSGDNTQPWRFHVNEADSSLLITIDESRDPSPMNAGQRMARVALGAAVENIARTAADNRWNPLVRVGDDRLYVRLGHEIPDRVGKIAPVIQSRATNRRLYDRQPLPVGVEQALNKENPAEAAVTAHWIVGRDRIDAWAALIGRADEAMFGMTAMRTAFLANVRFDAAASAPVSEGLSLASLELTRADRAAMRLLRVMPPWAVKVARIPTALRKKAANLVRSSSGLCLVVADDRSSNTDFLVGRVMQRAWLALTERGFAVQPMMSLPVLDNALENGSPGSIDRGPAEMALLGLRDAAPEIGNGRLAALLRFGYAPPPSGRTGRLPMAAVCDVAPPVRQRQLV